VFAFLLPAITRKVHYVLPQLEARKKAHLLEEVERVEEHIRSLHHQLEHARTELAERNTAMTAFTKLSDSVKGI
jgi:hypothetical protein